MSKHGVLMKKLGACRSGVYLTSGRLSRSLLAVV